MLWRKVLSMLALTDSTRDSLFIATNKASTDSREGDSARQLSAAASSAMDTSGMRSALRIESSEIGMVQE
jgi:hypothetical protein